MLEFRVYRIKRADKLNKTVKGPKWHLKLSKNHLMQNNALELIKIAKIEAQGLENIK